MTGYQQLDWNKQMKKIIIATVVAIALSCLFLSIPVLADYNFDGFPVETIESGTVNGGVFIGYEPWPGEDTEGEPTLTGSFDVPDGEVKWARLYTGIWGGKPTKTGWVEVTFNGIDDENRLGLIHLQGENDANLNVWGSGCGKHWMYYDVTDLVDAGSTNTATTSNKYLLFSIDIDPDLEDELNNESIKRLKEEFNKKGFSLSDDASLEKKGDNVWRITDGEKIYLLKKENEKLNIYFGNLDGRVYGIILVVVYEGGDDPKDIRYWINEGNDGLNYRTPHDEGTTDFDGEVGTDSIKNAKLTMVHLTAYDPTCSDCLQFNDNSLDTSMVDTNTFELNTWDVTDYVESEGNKVWYRRGGDNYVSVTNAILILERGEPEEDKPDLLPTAIKPYHYEWMEEENFPKGDPWFNLTNYVNVTVKNSRDVEAESFEVKLYADDELIGSERVDGLSARDSTDVKFEWKPEGEDPLSWTDTAEGAKLAHNDTSKTHTLRAVVDEGEEVSEENEGNNELTKEQKVVWNGYMADEPLENYAHGKVRGGLMYTTGDGQYRGIGSGTKYGAYYNVSYDLAIPGSTKLARLYIYYTWAQPDYKAPKIGVTLKTPSKDSYSMSMEKSYNDIKGDFGPYRYAWGTYAYNITGYMKESGTYVVSITNLNKGDDSDFATKYAIAAPAILVVYENITMPRREYWINEGADILIGGRRYDGGFLALEECKNTALFPGSVDLSEVEKAALGFISPWGDFSEDDVLYFNNEELGKGVYCGYNSPCSEEIDGISMTIGAKNAQVGIGAIDVTNYLKVDKNMAIQGDDGDNMMPCNAFLVISYPSTATATYTPAPTATPASTVNVTPTPTPALTPASRSEEKQKPEEEAPVPGFELTISLVMLIAVAYLLRKRRKL